jgi:hypothetical protein
MKQYTITEEQIKDIALGGGKTKIKEMFPEAFEEEITPEKFLLDILGDELTIKTDKEKYPNSVFYFKGETCLLELQKSGDTLYLWCSYSKIWNPICQKFDWDYSQTQRFLKVTIEDHFKLRDVTPTKRFYTPLNLIEDHFKLRDVTPFPLITKNKTSSFVCNLWKINLTKILKS